jgi:uncharacterized OsmC-like protein
MANDDVSTGTSPLRRRVLTAHNEAAMRTVVDCGEAGRFVLDEPAPHGGTGDGPTPLQAVLGALCGCEAVTFRRTATELGLTYSALDFEAAFTIDIRGRQGNRSVRPHFQTVRVRAVVSTAEPLDKLAAVIEETEARCPVLNLLLDAKVNLHVEWLRDAGGTRQPVPRPPAATEPAVAPVSS